MTSEDVVVDAIIRWAEKNGKPITPAEAVDLAKSIRSQFI
jgi:hypothetical protein